MERSQRGRGALTGLGFGTDVRERREAPVESPMRADVSLQLGKH